MVGCYFCLKDVDLDDPSTWSKVEGWVGGPKKDSMKLRSYTGGKAHAECIHKQESGQAPTQPSMFEENNDSAK